MSQTSSSKNSSSSAQQIRTDSQLFDLPNAPAALRSFSPPLVLELIRNLMQEQGISMSDFCEASVPSHIISVKSMLALVIFTVLLVAVVAFNPFGKFQDNLPLNSLFMEPGGRVGLGSSLTRLGRSKMAMSSGYCATCSTSAPNKPQGSVFCQICGPVCSCKTCGCSRFSRCAVHRK